MGQPFEIAEFFSMGMRRDVPRMMMPRGSAWNLLDVIPDLLDAPIAKRGGYSRLSGSTIGAQTYIAAGAYAPFAAGAKHIAIDNGGNLYTISGGTPSSVGAAFASLSKLEFYRDKLYIPAADGTTAPKSYDGSTIATVGGSPPAGMYTAAYKDMLTLARSSANPERIWFSASGNPASWDTTNRYWDATMPLRGIAALSNAIILFGQRKVERLVGSIPPPGSDMSRQLLYEVGCIDARSIVYFDDKVLWCSEYGVYMTDGAAVKDISKEIGLNKYWQSVMSAYTTSWSVAAGRFFDYMVISVMNGSTFVDAFMIDVLNSRWWRISNVKATMFWNQVGATPETYYGDRAVRHVNYLSTLLSPSGTVKNDGDGTGVTFTIELPWRRVGKSKANIREVYMEYDLEDAASDNPTLAVSYVLDPESTSYTQCIKPDGTSKTLAETTTMDRLRAGIRKDGYGVGLKIAQTNPSAVSKIYSVGISGHARETSRSS